MLKPTGVNVSEEIHVIRSAKLGRTSFPLDMPKGLERV